MEETADRISVYYDIIRLKSEYSRVQCAIPSQYCNQMQE